MPENPGLLLLSRFCEGVALEASQLAGQLRIAQPTPSLRRQPCGLGGRAAPQQQPNPLMIRIVGEQFLGDHSRQGLRCRLKIRRVERPGGLAQSSCRGDLGFAQRNPVALGNGGGQQPDRRERWRRPH